MAEYEALLSTVFMSKEIRETLEVIGLSGQFKMKSINRNTLGDRLRKGNLCPFTLRKPLMILALFPVKEG